MRPRKTLAKIQSATTNVRFDDLVTLLVAFGFELKRIRGSHHVFGHPDVSDLVVIQAKEGQAVPYQVRQILRIIERHGLQLPEDE